MEKIFKTKTGYCHILSDKIVLTRDGVIGEISETLVGNKLARLFFFYGVIIIFFFYSAYEAYLDDIIVVAVMNTLIAIGMLFLLFQSRNNSATPVIEREKITNIKFMKGLSYITRSRFVVEFISDDGNIKKRLIMLPDSFTGGAVATEQALTIMRDEGLLSI